MKIKIRFEKVLAGNKFPQDHVWQRAPYANQTPMKDRTFIILSTEISGLIILGKNTNLITATFMYFISIYLH